MAVVVMVPALVLVCVTLLQLLRSDRVLQKQTPLNLHLVPQNTKQMRHGHRSKKICTLALQGKNALETPKKTMKESERNQGPPAPVPSSCSRSLMTNWLYAMSATNPTNARVFIKVLCLL